MIYTKCIFSPRDIFENIRISVMSRHTLEDGKTPDERINGLLYDLHEPIFGPPYNLIGGIIEKK